MVDSIEDIARLCHQRNKIWCECHGDYSQVDWEDAPQWQRESAIDGVNFIIKEHPYSSPALAHQNWLEKKLDDGWVYGEVKDVEKKTHPCMVPYHDLSMDQRMKDKIFFNTVLRSVGLI